MRRNSVRRVPVAAAGLPGDWACPSDKGGHHGTVRTRATMWRGLKDVLSGRSQTQEAPCMAEADGVRVVSVSTDSRRGGQAGGRREAGMCLGPDRTGSVVTATYVEVANSVM